jgi:ribosomal protein L11
VSDHNDDTRKEFDDAVNMTASELEKWLGTDESKSVGQKSGGGESTGHESGRHIVKILKAKKSDLSENDYAHMRKVVGYTKRHLAQRPSGDIKETDWRYSLMNWGHDPTK